MNDKYTIGIEAGGTKVVYGLFDSHGAIVGRTKHPTDAHADGPSFSDEMVENIRALMRANNVSFESIEGIGVCMPSFIMYDEGRILMTSAIPRIKDFSMGDYLRERLPARIVLDNDANAAAIAEYRRGAGRGAKHMVYVVVGTGLGCGIIIDGKLFHGSYGWAGECGHMLATPDAGLMCGCENRGCFMSYVSGMSLHERVKAKLGAAAAGSPLAAGAADGRALLAAYNGGDAVAAEIISDMARYLAVCLYNLYQMLNINTYVFGGGLVNLGDALFSRVRTEFDKYDHIRVPVYFRMAELSDDAGIIGAAEFVKEI